MTSPAAGAPTRDFSRSLSAAPVPLIQGLTSAAVGVLVAVAVVGALGGGLLLVLAGSDLPLVLTVLTAMGLVAVPLVGRALVRTDRRSILGWILLVAGTATVVRLVLDSYARAVYVDQVPLPAAAPAEFLSVVLTSGQLALVGLAPLFLTGRLPAGRWWRVSVVVTLVVMLVAVLTAFSPTFAHFEGAHNPFAAPGDWGEVADSLRVVVYLGQNVVILSAALSVRVALSRLPAGTTQSRRHGVVLMLVAASVVAVSFLACLVLGGIGMASTAYSVEHAAILVFAVSAWVALVRLEMFDARQVLERNLRYVLLTVVVVVVYVLLVALLRRFADGVVPDVVSVAVSALSALLLRDLAQRQVARWVWGPMSDPATALARVGARLDAAARPLEILTLTTGTLCETVGLDGARLIGTDNAVLAANGTGRTADDVALPLTFAGESVGVLVVTPRRGDGGLSERQFALLGGVTRQLAAATQAVVTGEALLASQRRLVALRASERTRIRADLHDGLGPTLAGMAWGIDRARRTVAEDPPAAAETLERLAAEARGVVGEVRRLVHALTPSRLEEDGLIGAITHDAEALGARIDVSDECRRGPIPHEVEVAAYRIALEAATNASRHADAASLVVRLGVGPGPALTVEVEDDGRGVPRGHADGIGITSMRSRAAECGGTFEIGRSALGGTVVRAVLPMAPRP